MASSASITTTSLQLTTTSVKNYARNISLNFENGVRENERKVKMAKYCANRGHALIKRPQLQRQDNVLNCSSQRNNYGKRRYTVTGHQDHKLPPKRRRRFNSMVLPTKFLLGGNINDPLNLRSLENEEVNQRLNACTPKTSPIPISRHRSQIEVLIPPNIHDPLNLNTGEEIEFNIVSPKSRKRKRHRKSKKEEVEFAKDTAVEETVEEIKLLVETEKCKVSNEEHSDREGNTLSNSISLSEERTVVDKIVSPVVPQGSPSKFYKRFHSKSISKDDNEKLSINAKVTPRRRRSKSKVSVEDVTFRDRDKRFCYGNYCINYKSGSDDHDPRLRFLRKEWFKGKNVLDIGCNTGNITLYVAEYLEPQKILGIDIDDKLIDIARRNTCRHLSASVRKGTKFPMSLALSYGPLARLPFPAEEMKKPEFPNNVSFIQGNYVLSSDENRIEREEFDTVLCFRVSKWIHLNWGDDGIKRLFKRIFLQLRIGGRLLLEPHAWSSYSRKKKLTPITYSNFNNIKLHPEKFCDYLLSNEVGFTSCEIVGRPNYSSKGHRLPLYLFIKGAMAPPINPMELSPRISSICFPDEEWEHTSEEENEDFMDIPESEMLSCNYPFHIVQQKSESDNQRSEPLKCSPSQSEQDACSYPLDDNVIL